MAAEASRKFSTDRGTTPSAANSATELHVYLVPVGGSEYQPYCESEDPVVPDAASPGGGWWRRQVDKFRAAIAEAEEERRRQALGQPSERRGLAAWVMARIAEAIAEQRLLWKLRSETEAVLVHPDDLTPGDATRVIRAHLSADHRKHLRWCGIDGLLAAVLGPGLFFVPGPNILGWYFAFRALGHFFSLKGARQGLRNVTWTPVSSHELKDIRPLLLLDQHERLPALTRIGEALGLEHLAAFVNRLVRGRTMEG
jgi:hypothetical protein